MRKERFTLSIIAVAVLLLAPITWAQDDGEESGESQAHDDGQNPSWWQRFQVHGHLTTAFADSTSTGAPGLFAEQEILGVPEDGTFDYRIAALQVRYQANWSHAFVLQLSHKKLGDSVLAENLDDIELDWLFWRWKIGPDTDLRLGRIPTPAGIFNEVRDVGTLLPFFRPSFNFYREGSLFSETVDGVGISHRFFATSDWALTADVYYGEFEVFEQGAGLDDDFAEVDVTNAIGAQLWLQTAVDGLRVGLGALRWDVGEESQFNIEQTTWESWYLSVDGDFERLVARAEYRRFELPFASSLFSDGQVESDLYYWQLGWRLTPRLSFYLQSEYAEVEQKSSIHLRGSSKHNNRRDEGVAVNFALRPNVVFKAEYHEQRFDRTTTVPVLTPEGLRLRVAAEEFGNEYFLLGVALSF